MSTTTQTYIINKISELRMLLIEKPANIDLELVKQDLAKYEAVLNN